MSGWNDGISKELAEYFESLEQYGEMAIESVKEQIDIEVAKVLAELERTTPQGKTLGLIRSLQSAEITVRHDWYGYAVSFDGEDKDGTPYEKIANVLNFGSSYIKPTRFISKAIKNLKGLDERAMVRFENKIKGGE